MRFLLVVLVALSANAYSEDADFGIQIDHVTLVVSDIDKSADFYRDILLLSEIETPWGKIPWGRMFSTGAAGQLHLVTDDVQSIKLDKNIHYAFNVTDFDGYLEFLQEHAIEYGDFSGTPGAFQTRPDGVRQVYFQDPDGYWIEVNSAGYSN
jgi:catechol 2,3-dioxygenase-like lactoylglutathione lyase family enzyme